MQKTAIFVDVQNLYYTTRDTYGRHFDYNAFWARVTADRKVIKAIAYAIDRGDEKQQQFQQILRGIGFEVRLKRYIHRADGSTKGDWDVGIALDVMEYAADAEVVILGSGDGDFEELVRRVIAKYAVQVEVYGVPALTAMALQAAATRFMPIESDLLLKSNTRAAENRSAN